MTHQIWLPSADNVEEIHHQLVELFAEEEDPISPAGIRDGGLLESACNRPFTGIGTHEKYKRPDQKLAALFHSLTKNHPFHNGNKRTAVVALITALYRNDRRLRGNVSDDDIFDLVIRVTGDRFPTDNAPASGDKLIDAVADWIDANTEAISTSLAGMRTQEFLKQCEVAGCHVRKAGSGGSWVIQNPGVGSIRVSQSTQQVTGKVVRRFLDHLGLTASSAGIFGDEFAEEAEGERGQIRRFIVALRRLAKT
jgi:death-on-curing family protein